MLANKQLLVLLAILIQPANGQSIQSIKSLCVQSIGVEFFGPVTYEIQISMTWEGVKSKCVEQDPLKDHPLRKMKPLMSLGYMNNSIGWLCGDKALSVFTGELTNIEDDRAYTPSPPILPAKGYIFTSDRADQYKYKSLKRDKFKRCIVNGDQLTLAIKENANYIIEGTPKVFELEASRLTTVTTRKIEF